MHRVQLRRPNDVVANETVVPATLIVTHNHNDIRPLRRNRAGENTCEQTSERNGHGGKDVYGIHVVAQKNSGWVMWSWAFNN
jgi:hypothetical protein